MEKEISKGSLYLVPSPIGNLKDISPRIIDTLNSIDLIACEDTRNTSKLLNILKINKPLFSCHEHNEQESSSKLIKDLLNGLNVAYMSDAGYPGISDPGEVLVKRCIENNIKVCPISGPSAFINAIVASSLSTDHFLFYGFLNSKSTERIKELKALKDFPYSIIFYEAPHRINDTLKDLYDALGNRNITIAREISKIHEEFIYSDLLTLTTKNNDFKGEMVLIIEGNNKTEEIDEKEIIDLYNLLIKNGLDKKSAINSISILKKINKNYLKKLFL